MTTSNKTQDMETKFKYYLYILLVALLFVSCDDDDDTPDLIALADSTIGFETAEVDAMIIGESTDLKTIRFNVSADWNVSEATKVTLTLDDASDVPVEAYTYPSEVPFRKGLQTNIVEIPLDCSLIPFDDQERMIILDLGSEVCPLGDISRISIKVYRNVPTPEYHKIIGGFYWQDGGYVHVDQITNDYGAWQWMGFIYLEDTDPVTEVYGGIWQRSATELALETYSTPVASFVENGINYLEIIAEDELINESSYEWNSSGVASELSIVHPNDFGKSGYLAMRAEIEGVIVNIWLEVSVSEDGRNMIIYGSGWEANGLSIRAGQTE